MARNEIVQTIINATGIIPLEGVLVNFGGEKQLHEGPASIEVVREADTAVEAILPGNSIFRLTFLGNADEDAMIITFTANRDDLLERLK